MRKKYSSLAVLALAVLIIGVACGRSDAKVLSNVLDTHVKDSICRVERGRYLVTAMGCDDCHSPKNMGPHGPEIDTNLRFSGYPAGRPLPEINDRSAGQWILFCGDLTAARGPWGTSFAANISSDPTGIGNWTEAQFVRCLREGIWKGLPGGRPLLPPMPWQNFSKLNDRDLKSIYAYLKTTKPVSNNVPEPLAPRERRK